MNGVVFQTSTMITAHIAVCELAVQATGDEMTCKDIRIWLMTPNWSFSIHCHIFAETMVGMAQGISTAARTNARPLKLAFKTRATIMPSMVSIPTEMIENQNVF